MPGPADTQGNVFEEPESAGENDEGYESSVDGLEDFEDILVNVLSFMILSMSRTCLGPSTLRPAERAICAS